MATIQVKNLDEETVRGWKVRAAKSGQSLQEYMRAYLTTEIAKPTMEELLDQIERRSGSTDLGGAESVVDAIHAAREERDQHLHDVISHRADADSATR
jgi:plasmid stability protein